MSFHKQIERQLEQEFSPKEPTILVDYHDAVFYGRRLQALEMGRILKLAASALWRGIKRLLPTNPRSTDNLDQHLRQDIGLTSEGPHATEIGDAISYNAAGKTDGCLKPRRRWSLLRIVEPHRRHDTL